MRRGIEALGAAALLAALAAALATALTAAPGVEARGGVQGRARPVPRIPFRLTLPPPGSQHSRRAVPVVAVPATGRTSLLLIRVSWLDPMAYGVGAVNGEWAPYGRISAHNRVTELRSRTVLRYSVSNRVTFVGQALGSRLRMIGLTLVRFFGGVKVGAHPSGDRYTPLSESEAALIGARDRTVRRALAPRLSFPGFSLNLGGISVQAGVHVRLF